MLIDFEFVTPTDWGEGVVIVFLTYCLIGTPNVAARIDNRLKEQFLTHVDGHFFPNTSTSTPSTIKEGESWSSDPI